MDLRQQKQALRKSMANEKKKYGRETLESLSLLALNKLETSGFFRNAHCIAFYHAIPGEVQTDAFIEKWKDKKRILLPTIIGDDLKLVTYTGKESLSTGTFGILEPAKDAPEVPPREVELIVVPGIAFDRTGNRMGRGKGYYDRLLTQISAPKAGLCFDFQLVDKVPTEAFDRPMDLIITDREVILPV